ncbi:uncharacterized protein LOC143364561 [Halictus rubicundus]|uniref:uncharacterized protein LOC143364561 n=1 Tax=Halictus rubicundus TaxID=77578 RepID=UPI0040350FC7
MAMYRRGTSLRESFIDVLSRKSALISTVPRLKGNYLFRASARLVLEYIDWLTEEAVVEEISDDVAVNIRMAQQKKVEKKGLSLEDRSVLLTRPEERTAVEKTYIYELFKKFRAFRKYPEDLRESIARLCLYQYLKPGRVIVRQGREAENLYFIITGEVSLSRVVIDRWTDESKEIDMGILTAGDIFGEIALLHVVPRTATVITKTTVDLFLIPQKCFNMVLRPYLSSEWDILQDALVHFNYFKTWDRDTVRECCILSRMKDFRPDEVLLGDGKGMVNYVHFVLEGECRLIEHMTVHEEYISSGNVRYELYHPRVSEMTGKFDTSKRKIDEQLDHDRSSIITTTLLDVVNEWHKITDVVEMLMRQPSSISQQQYPKDVRTIFMQICTFERGACFGLGENMRNRRIVSTTNVRCFLVPRYFLNEHNRANIWEHVKLFMDSKYPTRKELFDKFVLDRKWRQHKKLLVDTIGKRGRRIHSNVTMHDVPYSIRIENDVCV